MSDQAMRYYERELAYVRKSLGQFAAKHPEQAAHLHINRDSIEDPNISRLIEGMAMLTAKTEQRMDEQLPDVVQDLFSLLYPGMTEVIPSYFPLVLEPDPEQMKDNAVLPKGSQIKVPTKAEESCQFTTISDLNIYPFILADVRAEAAPFTTLPPKDLVAAEAVIQMELHCVDPQATFAQLEVGDFEFYVGGFEKQSDSLIDLLLRQTIAISVSDCEGFDHSEVSVAKMSSRITDPDFQWLPQYSNQFAGYDLIRDYFSYPDKSAYFRVEDLGEQFVKNQQNKIVLNIYVKSLPAEFIRLFNKNVFSLYTVPAINRFKQDGEPLNYNASSLSMPIICDADGQSTLEVISVDQVHEIDAYGETTLRPLYHANYAENTSVRQWSSRQHWDKHGERKIELSVTIESTELQQGAVILTTDLWCCNGRTPCLVRLNSLVDNQESVDLPGVLKVAAVPSAPQYPQLDDDLYWRFIALLNGNFTSLLQSDDGVKALRDILALCSAGQHQSPREIEAIKSVVYRQKVTTMQLCNQPIFAAGTEIELTLDNLYLQGQCSVFAEVLNVFFQQFCSYDRFMQLQVRHFGDDSYIKQFDPVHGSVLCL